MVSGGLGNQLLAVAHGMKVARELKREIYYNTSWFDGVEHNDTPRPLSIALPRDKIDNRINHYSTVYSLLRRLRYTPFGLLYSPSNLIDLNWREAAGDVASAMELYQPSATTDDIPSARTGVHIRLGDYTHQHKDYLTCTDEYYSGAIEEFGGAGKVDIFTDSPELVPSLFPRTSKLGDIKEMDEASTFRRLSTCQVLIGSNSTFSLCAALSTRNATRIAVFPKQFQPGLLPNLLQVVYR
ncbi:alpha-1,2-fucosyltransferase [Sulfitobacter sp. W074]|uniref:alpha-1,2-fucosyltransferase n=1 Tax=Sulfitobacter sp. W074 TaxID=2867026 RepID=UPI0021A4D557|nr:alpha-1,2-fucosyltransferase [Sulfitobacter sp. W074]